jgi:L-aspartate oxidase
MSIKHYDVIIIGSGAAGLTAALTLAQDKKVLVLAKGALDGGSTNWAQGGIAAVLDAGDSFESHVEDTMIAGAGLNDRATVEFVVSEAPAAIERLAALGVPFNDGAAFGERWHLTREGGHSHRRIVHVDDATGAAVQQALVKAATANPNITLAPDMVAIDLITSRNAEKYSGDGACLGRLRVQPRDQACRCVHRPRDHIGNRRGRARLSLLDCTSRRDRGWYRDGLARGLPRFQHGDEPVSPNLPL